MSSTNFGEIEIVMTPKQEGHKSKIEYKGIEAIMWIFK